jgi:hypothetical protein
VDSNGDGKKEVDSNGDGRKDMDSNGDGNQSNKIGGTSKEMEVHQDQIEDVYMQEAKK